MVWFQYIHHHSSETSVNRLSRTLNPMVNRAGARPSMGLVLWMRTRNGALSESPHLSADAFLATCTKTTQARAVESTETGCSWPSPQPQFDSRLIWADSPIVQNFLLQKNPTTSGSRRKTDGAWLPHASYCEASFSPWALDAFFSMLRRMAKCSWPRRGLEYDNRAVVQAAV